MNNSLISFEESKFLQKFNEGSHEQVMDNIAKTIGEMLKRYKEDIKTENDLISYTKKNYKKILGDNSKEFIEIIIKPNAKRILEIIHS